MPKTVLLKSESLTHQPRSFLVTRAQRRGAWQILTPRTAAMFGRNLCDGFLLRGTGEPSKFPWILMDYQMIISVPDENCHDLGYNNIYTPISRETFHALESKAPF